MPDMQPSAPPVKAAIHWPSLTQLILSLLAVLLLLSAALIIVVSTVMKYLTNGTALADLVQPFMVAASLAFAGVLVAPSAWYAWRHTASPGPEPTVYPKWRWFGLALTIGVIILAGGSLLLGNLVAENSRLAWWLLPLLNVIANGLPALWLVYIGTRGLIPGAPRRLWGVFASGLVLGPLIILFLELLLLVFMGIIALLWIMINPSLANQLYNLVISIQHVGPNLDELIRQFLPFIVNPGIIFLMFAYISVLVPLLEEALKPIGVWFLSGQKITPAQGFGYGVLSGAGFGLFENLGNTSGGAMGWAVVASTRISTLMLHCFTAGLVGWALVSAWSERRYWRLLVTYLIAVIVHGLWNGMALVSVIASLQGVSGVSLPAYIQLVGAISTIGIIGLGVIVLILYIGANAILRRQSPGASLPPGLESQPPIPPGGAAASSATDIPSPINTDTGAAQLPSPGELAGQPEENDHPISASEKPTETKGLDE